jgi:regulation of enolase protein 1 (concanavalin A-like superfamily)
MPISIQNINNSGNISLTNVNNAGKVNVVVTTVTDRIAAQLTTNLSTYNAASVNDWIKVTSTEYTNVANNVSGVTKKGNTDLQVSTRAIAAGFTEFQFSINNNTGSALTIDIDEYPIGFVAETWNGTANVQFGYTTAYHTGAPTYSNSVTVTPVGACYYIRKAPTGIESAPATQTLYPALKISGNSFNLVPNTSGWYTTNGGAIWSAYSGNASNGAAKFQMLVTSIKSW